MELLVVLAIISVLAGLLFPVFSRAKTQAKLTTSLSNLKQIGAAISLYSVDYSDRLPYASNSLTLEAIAVEGHRYGPTFDPHVPNKLISEVLDMDKRVFRAPFDTGPASNENSWETQNMGDRWISYIYADWPALSGATLTSYDEPSKKTITMEVIDAARNPRIAVGKAGCLALDMHLESKDYKTCISDFPEPELSEL